MSVAPGRQGVIAFFVTFCVCLVALAVALNVGWVVLTLREIVPLLLGSLIFAAIITGLILNTTFLVREIRRNEQHDAFVNAVTHELKTPVTSIRLHLETLKARGAGVDESKRHEFYDVMLQGQRPPAAPHRAGAPRRAERARAVPAGAGRPEGARRRVHRRHAHAAPPAVGSLDDGRQAGRAESKCWAIPIISAAPSSTSWTTR